MGDMSVEVLVKICGAQGYTMDDIDIIEILLENIVVGGKKNG